MLVPAPGLPGSPITVTPSVYSTPQLVMSVSVVVINGSLEVLIGSPDGDVPFGGANPFLNTHAKAAGFLSSSSDLRESPVL